MTLRTSTLVRIGAACLFAGALALGGGWLSCGANLDGAPDGGSDMDSGLHSDLPADPQGDGNVTGDVLSRAAAAFKSAASNASGGPCLTEPSLGALLPNNFGSPHFEWSPGGGQDLFELRVHVDNQVNDLLVYTNQSQFSVPAGLWSALSNNSADRDIQISVRGGHLVGDQLSGGAFTGSQGSIRIAPVPAPGAIVYWTTSSNTALRGFHIGDKDVTTVLTPADITKNGTDTSCVGCHTSTPDGLVTLFGRTVPTVANFSVDARLVDGSAKAPGDITAYALGLLARTNQDLPTLSKAHYSASEAIVITGMNNAATNSHWELVWTDLRAPGPTGGTGIIARTGDTQDAAVPSFSHDGQTILYSSSPTNVIVDARLETGNADLWTVPYNNKLGGQAAALPGVNDPNFNQYYGAYAPGDTLIAFNRVPRGQRMYDVMPAEVWVAPGAGGTPMRVAGNDPPACAPQKSPGLTNSWPRWAPSSTRVGGKRYYWLVFSSRRRTGGNPQLFLSGVVTNDSGGGETLDTTYPAVWITSQPSSENNHTPAWDEFKIPGPG